MILVSGEALIDLVPVTVDGETAYLPRTGGSPYNVAVGLGRLGVPVAFFGRLSSDPFGKLLRDRLTAEAVDCSFLRSGSEPTALAIVHLAPGEEPHFVFYGERAADSALAPDEIPSSAALDGRAHALHFGSISLVREPAASAYERLMRRESAHRVLSLDPNVRPGLIGDRTSYRERLEQWVEMADVVKVSRADLMWLYPERQPLDAAEGWLARGPSLVVMTRGGAGAIALTSTGTVEVPGIPVAVRDTVGAGDAFSAGLLGSLDLRGLLEGTALPSIGQDDLRACLDFANTAAAITCTRSGADPPTLAEVLEAVPPPGV